MDIFLFLAVIAFMAWQAKGAGSGKQRAKHRGILFPVRTVRGN
jgi:hypothetical protein